MKRAVTVPPTARAAFAAALGGVSKQAGALPDPLPMGRVLRLVDKTVDTDEDMKVLAGQDESGHFLDYFRVDNDGQVEWHGRIRDDGKVEELENFEGQFGRKVFPGDPAKTEAELQRIIAHNERVQQILRAKGFK